MDNDAVIKICAYSLAQMAIDHITAMCGSTSVLGALKFIVPKQIERSNRIANREAALAQCAEFLAAVELFEPTSDEVELAARFENDAQEKALPLDPGETLCLAIMLSRKLTVVVTGDKRAITAVACLHKSGAMPNNIQGRVACFEQLMCALIEAADYAAIRKQVCDESDVDTVMRMCFACHSPAADPAATNEGLHSYIKDLQKAAEPILWKENSLLIVT